MPSVTSNTQYGTCSQHTVHHKRGYLDPAHVQGKKIAYVNDSQGVHLWHYLPQDNFHCQGPKMWVHSALTIGQRVWAGFVLRVADYR